MEPIKKIDAGRGFTIKIYPDDDPIDPRGWDNIGTMVCFHPNYGLGDENHGFTPETLQEKLQEPGILWLSLYLYDHSGISMSCGRPSLKKDRNHYPFDPGGWDTSLVGAIFVDRETAKKELGPEWQTDDKILEALEREVETYNQYLTGDVYGYIVEDRDREVVDSCWGYFGGISYCLGEAKAAAALHVQRDYDHEYGYCLKTA